MKFTPQEFAGIVKTLAEDHPVYTDFRAQAMLLVEGMTFDHTTRILESMVELVKHPDIDDAAYIVRTLQNIARNS